MSNLSIYLRNHEAAAQAGKDLFRRTAKTHRSQPWAGELQSLTRAVEADVQSLRHIMGALTIPPARGAGIALRLGERAGRLKLNGSLLSRSSLSDLIEIEGLLDAVHAKRSGWQALRVASVLPASLEPLLQDLADGADNQVAQLSTIHHRVAQARLQATGADGGRVGSE